MAEPRDGRPTPLSHEEIQRRLKEKYDEIGRQLDRIERDLLWAFVLAGASTLMSVVLLLRLLMA